MLFYTNFVSSIVIQILYILSLRYRKFYSLYSMLLSVKSTFIFSFSKLSRTYRLFFYYLVSLVFGSTVLSFSLNTTENFFFKKLNPTEFFKSVYNVFSFVFAKRLHYKKDYDILELKAGTFVIVFYDLTFLFKMVKGLHLPEKLIQELLENAFVLLVFQFGYSFQHSYVNFCLRRLVRRIFF